LETTRWNTVVVDEETGRTSIEGAYTGDVVSGAATVISAMGACKRTAKAMHIYIMNKKRQK
jgi:glutamate synthase (NADPH/NADH) small chain